MSFLPKYTAIWTKPICFDLQRYKGQFITIKRRSRTILNQFKLPRNEKQHNLLQSHIANLIRSNKAAIVGNYLLTLDNSFIKKTDKIMNQFQSGGMDIVHNVLKRRRPDSPESSRKEQRMDTLSKRKEEYVHVPRCQSRLSTTPFCHDHSYKICSVVWPTIAVLQANNSVTHVFQFLSAMPCSWWRLKELIFEYYHTLANVKRCILKFSTPLWQSNMQWGGWYQLKACNIMVSCRWCMIHWRNDRPLAWNTCSRLIWVIHGNCWLVIFCRYDRPALRKENQKSFLIQSILCTRPVRVFGLLPQHSCLEFLHDA